MFLYNTNIKKKKKKKKGEAEKKLLIWLTRGKGGEPNAIQSLPSITRMSAGREENVLIKYFLKISFRLRLAYAFINCQKIVKLINFLLYSIPLVNNN